MDNPCMTRGDDPVGWCRTHSRWMKDCIPCPSCASKDTTIARLTEELDALKWSIENCVAHYPEDIFPDPSKEDFSYLHQRRGASEHLHGSWARHLVKVIRDNAELRRRAGEGVTTPSRPR